VDDDVVSQLGQPGGSSHSPEASTDYRDTRHARRVARPTSAVDAALVSWLRRRSSRRVADTERTGLVTDREAEVAVGMTYVSSPS
jgi:hypothetical protein